MTEEWSFSTNQIHAGQIPDPITGSISLPIYQTTAYQFRDTDHAAALFALKEFGYSYTRIGNPTQEAVENRLTVLEGGVGSILFSSGMAATAMALMNVAEAGDHLVLSGNVYGGIYNLCKYTLPKWGVETTFVADANNLDAWKAAARPNTKAFFGEGISNPIGAILDIEGIANIAHSFGVPWIVDNTLATPYVTRPIDFGAAVVTHSATKFLSGHGSAIVGAVIDAGSFDFAKDPEKFPGFNKPDESYNDLVYAKDFGEGSQFGNLAYIIKCRVQLLRDFGSSVSPFNAWLLSQGLPNSKWHQNQLRYAPKGGGAVMSFEIDGGLEAGKKFINALKLFCHVANIGDVRSLAIHPASTTHSQLGEAGLVKHGISPGMIRLSIGIEDLEDIRADMELGFEAALK